MRFPSLFASVLAATTAFPLPLLGAETVSHDAPAFRLTVPDGFVAEPALVKGDVMYAFVRPAAGEQRANTVILVRRLGATIDREKLDPKAVARKDPRVSLSTEQWKGFEVEVIRVPENMEGVRAVTLNAQVPLKGEAIQVSVFGEEAHEEDVRGVLRAVLANLEGESSWSHDDQGTWLTSGGVKLAAAVVVGVVAVALVVRSIRRRKSGAAPA